MSTRLCAPTDDTNPMVTVQSHVDPAKPQSEDVVGHTDTTAWVIDGSDGRHDVQYSDDTYYSDGVWYARTLADYFETHLDDTTATLRDHVEAAIAHVADAYADLHGQDPADLDPATPPAAALALVRWRPDYNVLEYYNLGDCSLIVETDDERDIHVRDVGPRPFDAQLTTILADGDDDTPSRDAFLRDQFRKRNTPNGYYIASLDPLVAYNGLQGRIPLDDIQSALMFTDGVEPLVDTYDVFDSWASARSCIRDDGCAELISRLRHIEHDVDPDCDQYPRTKQSDDASIVFLSCDD